MLTPEIIKKSLQRVADSSIYYRGVDYFHRGLVKQILTEEDKKEQLTVVAGRIKGGVIYNTTLIFDLKNETIFDMDCDCPYDGVCKHIVALGLAYTGSLHTREKTATSLPFTPTSTAIDIKLEPFNLNDYFIVLDTFTGYTPTFFEKEHFYKPADLDKILKRDDITSEQRELLIFIKNNQRLYCQSPRPDLTKLFSLLIKSGFPIFKNFHNYSGDPINIDINPRPIKAKIIYEIAPMYTDKTKVRHNFFFRLSEKYFKDNATWCDNPFSINGSSLIYEHGNTIEFHQLTPLLTNLIHRLQPSFDDESYSRKIKFYQTKLDLEDIKKFEILVSDASAFLTLSSPAPLLKPRAILTKPQPALQVEFDNVNQALGIVPLMDYGIYRQNISESIYISRRYVGDVMSYRPPYEQPEDYIITVTDDIINYTKIDIKKEINFYQELLDKMDIFGFTKTLKCQKRGAKQLTQYFRDFWPELFNYANNKNYPIIFSKDELVHKQAIFRADFTTNINTENNWLYFDLACYCGDERITLEKLLVFMNSGQSFWKKDDGTIVEIANRQELERLVLLLKNFEEQENGSFRGSIRNTPELEYVMTSSSYYNSIRAKSFEKFLNRLQTGKPVKKVQLPTKLAKILRPYQKHGIEWLYFLRSYHFAGILADDMGLGKTLQTLSILALEKITSKPSIVICPKTLIYNWRLEAEKFFPELKVLIYDGSPKEREKLQKDIKQRDLVIIGYHTLKQDEAFFSQTKTQFNYAVLDEAQFIKNHVTKSAQTVKKLNADYRLALTGTPLENSVSELWSIYDFLMPGFLGNYEYFTKHFHKPIMDNGDQQVLKHLRSKVEKFMLRRTKSEVLKELPPKIEQVSQCHLSAAQNILYQQILVKVRGDVFESIKEKGFNNAQIHILAGLTKLRQACNHPALLTKDKDFHKYESTKLDMCLELVNEVAKNNRKVLIFSQFTSMLDIVSSTLKETNIAHLYLSGKTKNRQSLIDKFNTDKKIPVFLISLKAGGTGLNLTAADTVIIFDPWWNPSVENQAIDRAHRIGQTKPVNAYRLLTIGTIEEKIQALKQKKQHLFDAVINESGDTFKKLTWNDVKELFSN